MMLRLLMLISTRHRRRRLCVLNGGLVLIVLYGLYYTTLEFFAGLSWLLFIGTPMFLTANLLYQVCCCDLVNDEQLI